VRREGLPTRAAAVARLGSLPAKPLSRAPIVYEPSEGTTSAADILSDWTIHENGGEMYAVMYADKVKELREEKGLSRRGLAVAAGISESTARSVEREAAVQSATAWKVARVFGVEGRDIARPAGQ
jgi:DNA-binding XRE family transcriptional regulator